MQFILFIASFNSFFFIFLLFQKKPLQLHNRILMVWLCYLGLFTGIYALYSHELFTHFKLLSVSLISLLMLHGPFLYTYISALISGQNSKKSNYLLHLLPFLFFNLYIGVSSFFPYYSAKLNMENVSLHDNPPVLFIIFLLMTAFSGTIYFLISLKLFKMHHINISNIFSSSSGIDLGWLKNLVTAFGILWTALICITIIHHIFGFFSLLFCTDGLFLTLSIFVIVLGYFGLNQRVIFSDQSDPLPVNGITPVKYAGTGLNQTVSNEYAQKLTDYMQHARPYLNPDLSLSQLASELHIQNHHLSQVINEQFKLNFFDFINKYRVEEFKKQVANPANSSFSLLGIALDCGFNSKSTFNRIFKSYTGLTPSEYKSK